MSSCESNAGMKNEDVCATGQCHHRKKNTQIAVTVTIRRHACHLTELFFLYFCVCPLLTYLLTYLNSWLVYFWEPGRDASTRRRRNNRK